MYQEQKLHVSASVEGFQAQQNVQNIPKIIKIIEKSSRLKEIKDDIRIVVDKDDIFNLWTSRIPGTGLVLLLYPLSLLHILS